MHNEVVNAIVAARRAVDDSKTGHLVLGLRIRIWNAFAVMFPETGQARRDVLAALLAKDLARTWQDHWLLDTSVYGEPCPAAYRALLHSIPRLFEQDLASAVLGPSCERDEILTWCATVLSENDGILSCLCDPRAKTVLCALAYFQHRITRFDDELYADMGWNIVASDEVKAMSLDDPEYHLCTIEWYAEDLAVPDMYAPPEKFRVERSAYWHAWLSRVEFVTQDLELVRRAL